VVERDAEPALTTSGRRAARAWCLGGLAAALLATAACWLRHLPGSGGGLGHDWSYFLPRLLAGEFHAAVSGVFDTPWFTPAFGAGLPLAAHPASAWHSLPQSISLAFGPLVAAQATLLVAVAVAYLGAWLCARDVLGLGPRAALVAGLACALDSFLPSRMVVGHMGFHTQALAPLLAWLLLHPGRRHAACVLGAALVAAAIVFGGNVYGAPAIALVVLGAFGIAAWRGADWRAFALRSGAALLLALGLCAEKLHLAAAFVEHAPRDQYGLPLCGNIAQSALLCLRSLAIGPDMDLVSSWVAGGPRLERHEWEFALGPAVVSGALLALARARRPAASRGVAVVAAAALGAALLAPLVLVSEAAWLRQADWTKDASTLFRTWAAYGPLCALGCAVAVERLGRSRLRAAWLAAALATIGWAWWSSGAPRDAAYDPARILAAHARLAEAPPPPVAQVAWLVDAQGKPGLPLGRDDALAQGVSQLLPYEPLFGYRLERYPLHGLVPGPALSERDGLLLLRDPSSWIDPATSGRAPGGRLRVEERATAERFAAWRPVAWPRSAAWRRAEWIARAAWLCASALALVALLGARRRVQPT
jgi:hypothetical protein